MADPPSGSRPSPTYLGWRYEVLAPDPGPPPQRPSPGDRSSLSSEWISAQREDEARTHRPLYAALAVLGSIALLCLPLWPLRVLPGPVVLSAWMACAAVALPIAVARLQ
ncbi:hypothetical protein ACFQZ2_24345, partial [Streptomonospora algeriensis]